jgi:hypothetical protein
MTNYIPSQDYSLYTDSETGNAFTSIRGLAKLAGVTAKSALQGVSFFGIVQAEVLTAGGLQGVSLVPAKTAYDYIKKQAKKGNAKAWDTIDLLSEVGLTVYIHRETGYGVQQTQVVNDLLDKVTEARRVCKLSQRLFQRKCCDMALHPMQTAKCHDYITVKVSGLTAAQARELEAILENFDPSIGLDHYSDFEALLKIADVKAKFAALTKEESWQEKADRAIAACA